MRELIKQNGTVTKKGLYQKLAHECGCDKVGANISDIFDQALQSISAELIIDGDSISLR